MLARPTNQSTIYRDSPTTHDPIELFINLFVNGDSSCFSRCEDVVLWQAESNCFANGPWVRPEVIFFSLEHDVKAVADCLVHATLLQPIGS